MVIVFPTVNISDAKLGSIWLVHFSNTLVRVITFIYWERFQVRNNFAVILWYLMLGIRIASNLKYFVSPLILFSFNLWLLGYIVYGFEGFMRNIQLVKYLSIHPSTFFKWHKKSPQLISWNFKGTFLKPGAHLPSRHGFPILDRRLRENHNWISKESLIAKQSPENCVGKQESKMSDFFVGIS
jgi:hypothetical protein